MHTLNLPDKNRSSDLYISRLADSEGRVVISKDGDFVTSHIVHGSPLRLLQISTGNMPNSILLPLVLGNHLTVFSLSHIAEALTALSIRCCPE